MERERPLELVQRPFIRKQLVSITFQATVAILKIDIADDSEFERSGEQVNNDYAGARAVRSGKSSCATDEADGEFISSRSTARGRF